MSYIYECNHCGKVIKDFCKEDVYSVRIHKVGDHPDHNSDKHLCKACKELFFKAVQ